MKMNVPLRELTGEESEGQEARGPAFYRLLGTDGWKEHTLYGTFDVLFCQK